MYKNKTGMESKIKRKDSYKWGDAMNRVSTKFVSHASEASVGKICLMLQGNMEDADLSRLLYYNGNYPCEIRVDPWENMSNAA